MDARDRACGSTSLRAAPRPGRDSVGRVRSLIHFSNSPSRSRGAFLRPGFATLLHSPRIEGWAERRETLGAALSTRGACHSARKTRVNALLPRYALVGPIPVFSCFSADSESSIPGLTISSTHTPLRSRGAFCAPGGLHLCFAHPESRGGRSAERRSGACEAPVGHAILRQTRA